VRKKVSKKLVETSNLRKRVLIEMAIVSQKKFLGKNKKFIKINKI
jgi:hypothetical protein